VVTIAFLSCLQSRTSHLFLHCIISFTEFFGILDIDNTRVLHPHQITMR